MNTTLRSIARSTFAAALFAGLALGSLGAAPAPHTEKVVFAGGCFWGIEGVFESLKGVSNAVSGYSGGAKATAHYEIVSTGTTGHAESVEVTYDPAQISFDQLLKVFFLVAHDPTELNRQGPDEGTQYRSEIYYTTDGQKNAVQSYIKQLTTDKTFKAPIVTKVEPLKAFYAAEDYHQHFMQKNPDYPYIVFNDAPKVAALHKEFPQLVKPTVATR
jgi:peptide-methionine (S)-S-oxide reductase